LLSPYFLAAIGVIFTIAPTTSPHRAHFHDLTVINQNIHIDQQIFDGLNAV